MSTTTLTEQISKAQREADAAAAKAMALQDALDQKRSEAAAQAEERTRLWAQDIVDRHRETQRRLLEQWRAARLAVETAIVEDPQAVPRLWSQWADVTGELVAEHEQFTTAATIIDPLRWDREPMPSAPAVEMPAYTDLVDHVMRRLSETAIADASDRRRAELENAMQVEGLD